ncbi:MAG TPA: hypothetical protein P5119_12405 [Candidatus Aminicenantes bacterium]|nr:hypothetical protein [Candidatus Aminicenantes bacterium]HRY66126.1 hypothetical protein [Candidatus Aminicenantes bacterium]HRZ73040.1 hypothetical protein [Candidatus Aminicenantes bacterium]
MRKASVLSSFLALALFLTLAGTAAAQGRSITVPKGTKAEMLGPESFKLTTPAGYVFTITSFKKTGKAAGKPDEVGILGDCGIRDPKGKVVATGFEGVLKSAPAIAAAGKALKDIPPGEYIKIDDEVTWLPATMQFPSMRIFDRQAMLKLSPQPDPPGKAR